MGEDSRWLEAHRCQSHRFQCFLSDSAPRCPGVSRCPGCAPEHAHVRMRDRRSRGHHRDGRTVNYMARSTLVVGREVHLILSQRIPWSKAALRVPRCRPTQAEAAAAAAAAAGAATDPDRRQSLPRWLAVAAAAAAAAETMGSCETLPCFARESLTSKAQCPGWLQICSARQVPCPTRRSFWWPLESVLEAQESVLSPGSPC